VELFDFSQLSREELIADIEKLRLQNYHLQLLKEQLEIEIEKLICSFQRAQTSEGIEAYFVALACAVKNSDMSVRTQNVVSTVGIDYAYQLVEKTDQDLKRIRNFGPASLVEVTAWLTNLGIVHLCGTPLPSDVKLMICALIEAE